MLGFEDNNVYIADFGLSKRFVNSSNKHIPFCDNKSGVTGTMRYCSTYTHFGVESTESALTRRAQVHGATTTGGVEAVGTAITIKGTKPKVGGIDSGRIVIEARILRHEYRLRRASTPSSRAGLVGSGKRHHGQHSGKSGHQGARPASMRPPAPRTKDVETQVYHGSYTVMCYDDKLKMPNYWSLLEPDGTLGPGMICSDSE